MRVPRISWPTNAFLAFSADVRMSGSSALARTHCMACTMPRLDMIIMASTISLTALEFAPGELNTTTPRRAYSSMGMLFTPAPQRPMARMPSGRS